MTSFTFLILLCYFNIKVQAVYFTMSNIYFDLPGDRRKYPPTDHPLMTLYAATKHEVQKEEHFSYSIKYSHDHILQVFSSTGDVMFTKKFFETEDIRNITFQASVEDMNGMKDVTTVQLNISPLKNSLDCDFLTRDLCYWHSVRYTIYENRKSTIIGSLSSPYLAEMCAGYELNYRLLKGGNNFSLLKTTNGNTLWVIRSLKGLDRDVVRSFDPFKGKPTESGEYRNLTVQCSVTDPRGTTRKIENVISVRILDENDNPPIAQTNKKIIDIEINSNIVKKGQTIEDRGLMFIDKDSPDVNQHKFRILDDYLNIIDCNCTIYEDDRDEEPQTAIHCKLVFTKDMRIPESPYAVTLEIKDTTLLSGFGNAVVKLPIKLHFRKLEDLPKVLSLTVSPNDLNRPLLLYPSREVTVFRTATLFARITQPSKLNLKKGIESFKIQNDSTNGVFNVTDSGGILFVQNMEQLRFVKSTAFLRVQWENNKTVQMDELLIKIINEPTNTCFDKDPSVNYWLSCASFKTKKSCTKGCGLSTGGERTVQRKFSGVAERCMWRGDPTPGSNPTHLYSTCTPDIETCPDGICDPLENLHELICPQDCATGNRILFPLRVNQKTWRGFDVGQGICSCNNLGECSCADSPEKRKSQEKWPTSTKAPILVIKNATSEDEYNTIVHPNVSRHVGGDIPKCGNTCIMAITGSGILLLVVIAGMIFCWRLERVHKVVREKFSNQATDLQVPLSDYLDRSAPPSDTLRFNFDVTTALTSHVNRVELDPKWEFPRRQLTIEQTLGEGEFGRVLRARALDIAGQSGYTTVAVKTLKDDAGERELSDLLSEYQLLKEVSHPNIIRLLGASTLPGGPIYLIIEYAEHGSLRNHLRRSRHLKTGCQISSNITDNFQMQESYDEPKINPITPKDILSFAWQISKGMAYLSEIKLVHRDLAARNVLLASEYICKISDFGLTRDVYEDDAYLKRSKGRVPVKWMAPESLSDHVYTNKSDVWSFGVLLWELVTLGASPYPGIVVQSLFHLLKTGYRMERPENCSIALYKILRSCWHEDPEKRPSFAELSAEFERMLSDEVQYLDLTANAVNNRSYFYENMNDTKDFENKENIIKNNADAVNYMNRSIEYEKCGDTTKITVPNDENKALLFSPPMNNSNHIGYETPVKTPNKVEELKTPSNEFPHYGYTDMTSDVFRMTSSVNSCNYWPSI